MLERKPRTTLTVKEGQIIELKVRKLDMDRVRYMRNDESKCGKVKGTQHDGSHTIEKAGETVSYWK